MSNGQANSLHHQAGSEGVACLGWEFTYHTKIIISGISKCVSSCDVCIAIRGLYNYKWRVAIWQTSEATDASFPAITGVKSFNNTNSSLWCPEILPVITGFDVFQYYQPIMRLQVLQYYQLSLWFISYSITTSVAIRNWITNNVMKYWPYHASQVTSPCSYQLSQHGVAVLPATTTLYNTAVVPTAIIWLCVYFVLQLTFVYIKAGTWTTFFVGPGVVPTRPS